MSYNTKMNNVKANAHSFCVAPMMEWTDRHCRAFMRELSSHAFLYTEMLSSAALHHGDKERLLAYSEHEHPVALQIGGSDPKELAQAAKVGESWGYDEINLNVGCPSDRVQKYKMGACLMREAKLVADCVTAMRSEINIPVTVKTRIGIDDLDSQGFLSDFVGLVRDGGSDLFIIHARCAWLHGLSPKENREVPPLNYPRVYQLKKDFPELTIILNGGVKTLEECQEHLRFVDGVMLGREVYHNPWLLSQVDASFYEKPPRVKSRIEAMESYLPYVRAELSKGTPLQHITRHILGLYSGVHGGKRFRRCLSDNAHKKTADLNVLLNAMKEVEEIGVNYAC
jgi:tRNA-dihydrouridine synthase A